MAIVEYRPAFRPPSFIYCHCHSMIYKCTCYTVKIRRLHIPFLFVDAQLIHRITASNLASTALKRNCQSQPNKGITARCSESLSNETLDVLNAMHHQRIHLDFSMYASFLQACTNTKALTEGKQVHAHILTCGLEQNHCLGTRLVSMYAVCGSMANARLVFDKMYKPNVFLWNAIIRGYASSRFCEEVLALYYQMKLEGVQPDNFTFPFVLKACAGLSALQQGKAIHDQIIRTGLEPNFHTENALIDMYAKCGNIKVARQLFDKMSKRDVVSWNAMIAGYAQNGHANEALTLFHQMRFAEVKPDSVTVVSVLPACAHLAALQEGKLIHDYIINCGLESDVSVGNALVDMYAKCGSLEVSRQLFDKMSKRDAISWNAMIAGYVQNGYANDALKLFRQMELACVTVASATILSVLPACAHLAALQQGIEIHSYIIRRGFELDIFIGSALLDMYAKCGNLETARLLFDKMSRKDVVSWNAMISGYGLLGYGEDALTLFEQMQTIGMKPNDVTFTAILTACRHAGLVDEGWVYFNQMTQDYHISPRVEHYTAMVDLLGRVGRVNEAHDFIKKMPLEPDARVWGALLGACRNNCNIELGELVAEHLLKLEPEDAGYYVLLSNIYASAGRWDDVAKVRKMMTDRGLKKDPGYSWIEVNKRFHAFLGGDRSHPQSEKLYAMLENMAGQMKEAGYVPDTNFVLHDVEKEEKNYILCGHSEKLAIAFGLINTCPGTPIRITKNLRACGDCHNATKFISKITGREIIVRDANRFHHFKDGHCTCGDYWCWVIFSGTGDRLLCLCPTAFHSLEELCP
eukprot:Gb_23089 [translate_table: standard]